MSGKALTCGGRGRPGDEALQLGVVGEDEVDAGRVGRLQQEAVGHAHHRVARLRGVAEAEVDEHLDRVDPPVLQQGVQTETHTEREREMFYLTTHSTHSIYGYMAPDIW